MRRRLRQQTRMREALLVDLGALVYELHRHGRREPGLLQAKASELTVVDQEVRALADSLGAGEGVLALVSAGIAGSCERCGTLLSTDARYCSGCGAEAAPSLPGSAPAAAAPAGTGSGVGIGGGDPGEPAADEPAREEPGGEEQIQPSYRDLDPEATGVIGGWEQREDDEPEDEEYFEEESEAPTEPSAPAPWPAEEPAEQTPDDAAPAPTRPRPDDPPSTTRRRSGGAVGKVSAMLRRGRSDG